MTGDRVMNEPEDIRDLVLEVREKHWKGRRSKGSGRYPKPANCLAVRQLPALFYEAYLQIDSAGIPTGVFEEIHTNRRILNEQFFHRIMNGTLAKHSISLRKYQLVLTRCLSVLLERDITQFMIQNKPYGDKSWCIRPDDDEQPISRTVLDSILELENPTLRQLKALHLAERSVNLSLGISLTIEQCREILARTSTRG